MVTDASAEQYWNALTPIEVTEGAMVTEASEEQPLNALSPIEVTPDGISTWPFESGWIMQ